MRLIDADALLKKLDDSIWYNVADFNEAWYAVDHAPTVDAVPVRKGQWIYEEINVLDDETDDGRVYRIDKWWTCSECGHAKGLRKPDDKFCPNCGARMDGKDGKQV